MFKKELFFGVAAQNNRLFPATPKAVLGSGGIYDDTRPTVRVVVVQWTSCDYMVFISSGDYTWGDDAYVISEPSPKFFEDLKNKNMADSNRAREIY